MVPRPNARTAAPSRTALLVLVPAIRLTDRARLPIARRGQNARTRLVRPVDGSRATAFHVGADPAAQQQRPQGQASSRVGSRPRPLRGRTAAAREERADPAQAYRQAPSGGGRGEGTRTGRVRAELWRRGAHRSWRGYCACEGKRLVGRPDHSAAAAQGAQQRESTQGGTWGVDRGS